MKSFDFRGSQIAITSAQERAIWCNEYILKNADEVWAGDITPGHTLASLVAALAPKSGMRASEPA